MILLLSSLFYIYPKFYFNVKEIINTDRCFNDSEAGFEIKYNNIFFCFNLCEPTFKLFIKVPKETHTPTLNNLSTQINSVFFLKEKLSWHYILCVINCLPIIDQEMLAYLNFISGLEDRIKRSE